MMNGILKSEIDRRDMLKRITAGFGYLGLAGMLSKQARAGLDAMRAAADAVLVLPNQGVSSLCSEEASAMETFESANRMILELSLIHI